MDCYPLDLYPLDFTVTDHGSITTLLPRTEAAQEWCNEHLPEDVMTFGPAIVIEPRYLGAILEGLVEDGFTVEQE